MKKQAAVAGCTATGLLKMIALVFMMIDHSGKMVFGNSMDLRLLGRIAFPLYAWCMVVGVSYTRSVPKYLLRLLALFVLSQPIYMVALDHPWNEPNIFLTLSVGLLGLWGLREKRFGSQVWAPLACLVLAEVLGCDYGWRGVMLMLLLWAVRDKKAGIAAVFLAFCLYWGASSTAVRTVFGFALPWLKREPWANLLGPWFRLQGMALLALPLVLLPLKNDVIKMPRWVGYAVYPLHLVVLIVMEGTMLPSGWAAVSGRVVGYIIDPLTRLFGG